MNPLTFYVKFYKIIDEENASTPEVLAFLNSMYFILLSNEMFEGGFSKVSVNKKINYLKGVEELFLSQLNEIISEIRKQDEQ